MKDKIDKIINAREWSFAQISDMENTIAVIVNEVNGELTSTDKLNLIWESVVITDETIFGSLFNEMVKAELSALTAERIASKLKEAKIIFNETKVEEVKIDLPPPPPVDNNEKPVWPKEVGSDGIETPKGVKRV
tara:strand:- start:888 stop:1289 length:402 start_codon:yes stop_codon:yes gene_type:complete